MSPTASQYISLYLRHSFQQHIHEWLELLSLSMLHEGVRILLESEA